MARLAPAGAARLRAATTARLAQAGAARLRAATAARLAWAGMAWRGAARPSGGHVGTERASRHGSRGRRGSAPRRPRQRGGSPAAWLTRASAARRGGERPSGSHGGAARRGVRLAARRRERGGPVCTCGRQCGPAASRIWRRRRRSAWMGSTGLCRVFAFLVFSERFPTAGKRTRCDGVTIYRDFLTAVRAFARCGKSKVIISEKISVVVIKYRPKYGEILYRSDRSALFLHMCFFLSLSLFFFFCESSICVY